ncbi:neuropeptide FF receptor 1 like 2 [Nelusetta ayraudi]|uniref:neuropeptide FF receptor 1 like 2 n=1 Tax=Nelusetta ayraudi TaxID=303726 RepID=UPI003F709975
MEVFHNVSNVTISPYYQHSLLVATGYILAYLLIFLLCMVGNVLVCLIVMENRHMRTVINLFIFNLAVSDLLVGIFCIPITLVDNLITGWPFSSIVCKMSGFVQGVSVSASVFTLVAIAVERFRCIVYPLQPRPTMLVAKAAVALIWVLAMVIMCPAAAALTVKQVRSHYTVHTSDRNRTIPLYMCYENFAQPKMRKVYTVVLFVHIYLAPLAVIGLMYGSIAVKLYRSVLENRKPRRQPLANGPVQAQRQRPGQHMISQKKIMVIKMLIMVTLLFMLSWLPLWTLMMMIDYAEWNRDQWDLLTSYIFPFAHWLAFSNSSVNPIIYGYYNENFKRGFQAVCRAKPFSCAASCCRVGQIVNGRRGERSVQAASRKEGRRVSGMRNRVHNTDKTIDRVDEGREVKAVCVVANAESSFFQQGIEMAVVHRNDCLGEASARAGSQVASVCNAWEN